MSLINTQVPAFKATAYHNGKFVPVTEDTSRASGPSWCSIPADFTFVCPTELGDLADNYAEFKKLGAEVYGVSTDTHFTHKAWHDTSDTIRKVQYPLVGDPSHQLARFFQVLITEGEDPAWRCAAPSSSTPKAGSRPSRCTTTASAATPRKPCAG